MNHQPSASEASKIMLTYRTAGESHGKCILALVEGFPAGVAVDTAFIDAQLKRRQGGYGRGGRMKIETDAVEILSGVRKGVTLGSPICLKVANRDCKIDELPDVTQPRPGHADLAGAMKYGTQDVRNVLERASARETAGRVAAGALAQSLLRLFGIEVVSYVMEIGGVRAEARLTDVQAIRAARDASQLYCLDKAAEKAMVVRIEQAIKNGDSVGGVFEVVAFGVPPGLGSCAQWTERLDGRLAQGLMAIQAIKGVEIGLGFRAAGLPGSQVHDEILLEAGSFKRASNNAGGIEGGMSNGEPIVARAAMKPIPTLRKPLRSVDLKTKQPVTAAVERSDVCAVPAASVVGEAAVAFEIAVAFLEKFGGDSLAEVERNCRSYLASLKNI